MSTTDLELEIGRPGPAGGQPSRSRRRRPSRSRREGLAGYLFLTPWFVGLLLITAGPLLASLVLSFTDFSLLKAPDFVGLANYSRMLFDDQRFVHAVTVTMIYVFVTVPVQLAFALLIALLLNRRLRGLDWYRALIYVPSLFGGSVAVAIVWRQLFNDNGVVNTLLGLVGVTGVSWISNPETSLGTLILLHVWQFGSPMVIFLAALKQVPVELYDAASVDGAGRWRRFWSVTFPMLTPVIFFNLVLEIIRSFQAFTPAYIISNGTGGPADSTLFYTLYLYQEGFANFRMGYAAALAWVLLLIIAALTGINFALSRFWVFYPDERRS